MINMLQFKKIVICSGFGGKGMADANGMNIINNHIKTGEYSNIYLLCGTEKYLLEQYKVKLVSSLTDMSDTMNYVVYKGENAKPDSIAEFALTMPFFADRRVVLVCDSDFFKKGNADMEEVLANIPDTTVIIFAETAVDKRTKLYKLISKNGTIAVFDTPDEKTLLVWVKSLFTNDGINIDDMAVYKLIESVGTDMWLLVNEAEKLKGYCIESKTVTVDAVERLSVNQIEGKIFDMMEALSKRDKEKTMQLYDDLLKLKEPAMRILFLITRQFNLLLKTKLALEQNHNNAQIASLLKLPPFVVKKYINQCDGYTYKQLLDRVGWCQDTDTKIKTGALKDGLAIELLIIQLLQR